jgi:predicted nicotinamide N-methyase
MKEKLKHYKVARDLIILKGKNKHIKKLKENGYPSIHGYKVWKSSFLIMDYLDHHPIKRRSRVIELGSGWGLLSIYLNKAFNAEVTAVDADRNVFPFLDLHAKINQARVKPKITEFANIKREKFGKTDYIFGSDICFWGNLTRDLTGLVDRAMESGVKKIVFSDPGRSPFLKLHKKCRKKYSAELIEWDTEEPSSYQGYLMVITQ